VTPYQLKAARAVLGWSRLHLALRSATSEHIVTTYEKTGRVARLHDRTKQDDPIAAIRATLEASGVEFFNARTPGARMRKPGQ